MLSKAFCDELTDRVRNYWCDQLAQPAFHALYYQKAAGKEGGHQLADAVDELTTCALRSSFPLLTGIQCRHGEPSPRSMGDLWLRDADTNVWHPMNVKTGLIGAEGQPNLVALKKLLNALLNRQIDAYYLMFVKFKVNREAQQITPSVFLADLLEWIAWKPELFTFDSGPGQLMLRAKDFFRCVSEGMRAPTNYTIVQKVSALFEHYEDGERRLRENRERDLKKFRERFVAFQETACTFTVDLQAQQELDIQ